MERRKRRALHRRGAAAGVVVAVGTGAGLLISSVVASASSTYITAAATTAGVSETLPLTGLVVPVKQVSAAFQVAGTVSSVDVSMGQRVNAGQKLATIDSSSLQQNVTNDQAALTAAEAKLSADEENQSAGASSGTGAAATTSAFSPTDSGIVLTAVTIPSHRGGTGTGTSGSLAGAQQAVVAGQRVLDADMHLSAAALRQAQLTCATGSGGRPPGPTTTSSSTSTTSTSSTSTPTSTTVPGGGGGTDAACVTALGQAEQVALKVDDDEQALAGAENNLAQLLSKEASTANTPGGGSSGSGGRSQSGKSSTPSGLGSQGTSATTDTPQQLASDQATIDSDEANLVVAQQDLSDAVLVAPISGMVVGVGLTNNQTVSAGSSSSAVTITSVGTYEAEATLTTEQVSQLAEGDTAQVTVNGVSGTFTGTVTRIGPVQSSNSSYTYPLVIALDNRGVQFPGGADAQLTVYLHSVGSAVVVPTSAVHTTGSTHYVMVPKGSSEQQVPVTIGVVGAVYTQITSGLSKGSLVILADRSTKVPSSNTQSNTNSGGFGGSTGNVRVFNGGQFGGFTPKGGGG